MEAFDFSNKTFSAISLPRLVLPRIFNSDPLLLFKIIIEGKVIFIDSYYRERLIKIIIPRRTRDFINLKIEFSVSDKYILSETKPLRCLVFDIIKET